MIANFPGLVRDAFFWHSPYAKKEMFLFKDVPQRDFCGKNAPSWPSFSHWPKPAAGWRGVATKVIAERFPQKRYMCVHIRGEKMVLRMHSERKIPLKVLFKQHHATLAKCVDGIARVILAAMKVEKVPRSALFLISDLSPETGSPSSARDRSFRNWTKWAGEHLAQRTGGGRGFCGTPAADEAAQQGPPEVREAMDYP